MPTKQNGIFNTDRPDFPIKCTGTTKHEREKFLENVLRHCYNSFWKKSCWRGKSFGASSCVTLWVPSEKYLVGWKEFIWLW